MRSASPARAGIGRTTTSDAPSVANTASTDFFKRDFAEQWTSNPFSNAGDASVRRRQYRGPGHPSATGDGHA